MRVLLRNPTRELTLRGPRTVISVLNELSLHREAVLVIRNGTLVPGDDSLADDDVVEIRPVISGGMGPPIAVVAVPETLERGRP